MKLTCNHFLVSKFERSATDLQDKSQEMPPKPRHVKKDGSWHPVGVFYICTHFIVILQLS